MTAQFCEVHKISENDLLKARALRKQKADETSVTNHILWKKAVRPDRKFAELYEYCPNLLNSMSYNVTTSTQSRDFCSDFFLLYYTNIFLYPHCIKILSNDNLLSTKTLYIISSKTRGKWWIQHRTYIQCILRNIMTKTGSQSFLVSAIYPERKETYSKMERLIKLIVERGRVMLRCVHKQKYAMQHCHPKCNECHTCDTLVSQTLCIRNHEPPDHIISTDC